MKNGRKGTNEKQNEPTFLFVSFGLQHKLLSIHPALPKKALEPKLQKQIMHNGFLVSPPNYAKPEDNTYSEKRNNILNVKLYVGLSVYIIPLLILLAESMSSPK